MRRPPRTVAEEFPRASTSGRATVVHELHDRDGDRAKEDYVYEPLLAHYELAHEPPAEKRGGQ